MDLLEVQLIKSSWTEIICFKEWLDKAGILDLLKEHKIKRRENEYSNDGIVLFLFYGILFGCINIIGLTTKLIAPIIACLAGLSGVPNQSAVSRFLKYLKSDAFQHMSNKLLQLLKKDKVVRGRVIAFDATYLEVYGKYNLAAKVYSYIVKRKIFGFKLMVAYDAESQVPLLWWLVPANHHETKYLISMIKVIRSKGYKPRTVLFDKGYYDGNTFNWLCRHRIRFVTPAKEYEPIKKEIGDITLEEIENGYYLGEKPIRINGCRSMLRLIVLKYGKRKFALLTNDNRTSGKHIHKLYRLRWSVENFFKDLKENYQLKRFPSTRDNVVKFHIELVFIAYMVLRLYRSHSGVRYTITELRRRFVRLKSSVGDNILDMAVTLPVKSVLKLTLTCVIFNIRRVCCRVLPIW